MNRPRTMITFKTFLEQTSKGARQIKYEFHREPENWFIATADGVEISRHQGKSQFDSSAAQDEAKKSIATHRGMAIKAENDAYEDEFQNKRPLTDAEKTFLELHKKFYIDYDPMSQADVDKYQRYAESSRKSLSGVIDPMKHPLAKQMFENLNEESHHGYLNRLRSSLGIKELGKGRYANVFQHPTMDDVAVKVYHKDNSYTSYLNWCQKNQGNKYVPKILAREVSDSDSGKLNIVFFEKLKPSSPYDIKIFVQYCLGLVDETKLTNPKKDYKDLTFFRRVVWGMLSRQTEDKDLAIFAKYFLTVFNSVSFTPDLHNANVMLRGSQLVFVDPVS
jgi:hypothetical protein